MRLHLENLEDRNLLSGNVSAALMPSGLLQIHGDAGNNRITIFPAIMEGGEAGDIRVKGDAGAFTTINGGVFSDFADTPTTGIAITMLNGNDSVMVHDITLPGNLTVAAGSGTENFVVNNIEVNVVQFTAPGPGFDTVSMDFVQAGLLNITTGSGGAHVSLDDLNLGTTRINTNPATAPATVQIFGSSLIGNLTIEVGNSGSVVTVDDTHMQRVSITVGNDSSNVDLTNLTVAGSMDLTVGLQAAAIDLTSVEMIGGNLNLTVTGAPQDLALIDVGVGNDLNLTIGDDTGLADNVELSQIFVGHDLNLAAGTAAFVFHLTDITVGNDLNFTSGDGDNIVYLKDIAVADALTVQLGSGINSLCAQNLTAFFGSIDGGSGGSNVYEDLDGNFGYYVTDFIGYE